MSLELTPEQAAAHIQNIGAARDQAVTKLGQLMGVQEDMLSSGWQGESATTYGKTSSDQHDRFHQIVQTLDHAVSTGTDGMQRVGNHS